MSLKNCIVLQACSTNEYAYTRGEASTPENEPFWSSLIGEVVEINSPADFPDIFYKVISVCFTNVEPNTECVECFNAINSLNSTNPPLQERYVFPTGQTECSNPEKVFVLINCNANKDLVFPDTFAPADIIQSSNTGLVTATDLTFYVGSVVKLSDYPENCYTVYGPYTEDTGCPCAYYTVSDSFPDCECCIGPIPVPWVRFVQEPVRDHTVVRISECDIQTNKKFAENYYKLFKGLKYGIENCCNGIDYDKLWIQKELSDYSLLKDPDLC